MDRKRIATLFLIVLADMSGAAAIIPIIPVYVLGQFHASPLEATLAIAAYYVAQVLAAPWLGRLSDRIGRRPILLASQAGTILSYLLLVLAAPLGAMMDRAGLSFGIAGGLVVVYLARILDGVTGGNISVAQAYASDISSPEARTHALGLVGGAGALGHIVGPAMAGLLVGFGLLTPFWAAAGVSVVTLGLTFLWLHEPQRQAAPAEASEPRLRLADLLRNRSAATILGTALLIGLYMAAMFATFSLYTQRVLMPNQPAEVVVRTVSFIITGLGLAMALTQTVLLRPLVAHLGENRAILAGGVLMLASALGLFAATSLAPFVAFVLVFALGYGIAWPSLQSLLTSVGKEHEAGQLLGWFQSAFSLALIVGPIWAGAVFTVAPQLVFVVGAALVALGVALSVGLQRLPQGLPGQGKPAFRGFHH